MFDAYRLHIEDQQWKVNARSVSLGHREDFSSITYLVDR